MRTALVSLLFASTVLSMKAEQVRPGVYKFPLDKHFAHPEAQAHKKLRAEHPRVGNWTESEMWENLAKMPV